MYRYTTPTLPITIDGVNFADVDYFRIAIEKGNTELLYVINANDERVDAQHNTINLALTQEESALFSEGYAQIQARIRYTSGSVQATNIGSVSVKDVLDEVII